MIISIAIEFHSDSPKKADVVQAVRDAAARISGQIEQDIIGYPLETDEQISFGSHVPAVMEVLLFRSE